MFQLTHFTFKCWCVSFYIKNYNYNFQWLIYTLFTCLYTQLNYSYVCVWFILETLVHVFDMDVG